MPIQEQPWYPPNFNPQAPIKKNKKIYFIFLGVLAFVFVLIIAYIFLGNKNTVITPKQVNLTFWGYTEDASVVQPIIDDYISQNPNVSIKYEKRSTTAYKENLKTRLENGSSSTLPDIVEVDSRWTNELSKYLFPASTSVITVDEFNKEYFASTQTDLEQYDSSNTLNVYGLPLETNGLVLFYNKNIITSPSSIPTNWTSFKEYAKTLTKKEAISENNKAKIITQSGVALGAQSNVHYASDILQMLMMQNRVRFPDFYQDNAAFESKENMALATNFYKSFSEDEENSTWDMSFKDSIEAFADGKVAMIFGYSEDIDKIKVLNPKLNFGTTLPPIIAGQIHYASNSSALVAPNLRNDSEESWKFMRFYTNNQNLKKIFNTTKSKKVYPSKELLRDLEKDPLYAPFAKIAATAQSWRTPNLEKVNTFFKDLATNNTISYSKEDMNSIILEFYGLYDQQ